MSDPAPDRPTGTQLALKWTIFLGTAALVAYLCLLILRPFLNVIAWSAVLAITFYPVHQYVVRKTGRAALSALISSALVVVAFVIPLMFVAGVAINQFRALADSAQQTFVAEGGPSGPVGQAYEWLTHRLGLDGAAIVAWIREHARELARVATRYTLSVAASVTAAIVSLVFIVFTLFLLFRDGHRIVARIPDLLPFERTRSEALLLRIREVIRGAVYGVVVIALIQGALCGGMFWVLGIPSAALWGLVTVLTSVIPMIGAAGVWVPGTLYLALTRQWPQAVILAIWGTAVISGIDNFLRPRLVGGRVGLSELVMFFALLGGLQAFGILGIVLGPVVLAIAASIVDVLNTPKSTSDLSTSGAPPIIAAPSVPGTDRPHSPAAKREVVR
jgi:predicted PurR-regulated permease PerM